MLLQIDIIPSISGYGGASCESGILLADNELKNKLKEEYPEMYERFEKRRDFIQNVLNIHLSNDVLPMNDTVGYYRPYFLYKELALVQIQK